MNDNDFDKILREKATNNFGKEYKKTSIDNVAFLANQKKKKILTCRIAVYSMCVLVCIGVFIYIFILNKYNNLVNNNANAQNEEINIKQAKTILYDVGNKYENCDIEPECILIVKLEDVQDMGLVNGLPKTIINAEIVEVLVGSINQSHVEFRADQSIVKANEIPDEIRKKIKSDIDDEYVRIVLNKTMINSPYPEKGKYYIATLIIEKDELKIMDNSPHPFYEADIENRKVKIGDEWVKIEIYN